MTGWAARQRQAYDLALEVGDFSEWRGSPQKTLLICTQQRSGSTLLGEALYFARGLGCPLEYFHLGFRPAFEKRWQTSGIPEYAAALHRFRTDPGGVFSAKLFWWDVVELVRELAPADFESLSGARADQTEDDTYRRIFTAIAPIFPSPAFVFLTRRDEIRQAISYSVAAQTGSWRDLGEGRQTAGSPKPAYDFHQIVHALAEIQNDNAHWLNFFRANGLACQRIFFEDLVNNHDATVSTLFDALGRSGALPAKPRLRKQSDSQSEELLQRFVAEFAERAGG